VQWYFRKINFENIYVKYIENEKIVNMKLQGLMGVFITHKFCLFMNRRDWSVIFSLIVFNEK